MGLIWAITIEITLKLKREERHLEICLVLMRKQKPIHCQKRQERRLLSAGDSCLNKYEESVYYVVASHEF